MTCALGGGARNIFSCVCAFALVYVSRPMSVNDEDVFCVATTYLKHTSALGIVM